MKLFVPVLALLFVFLAGKANAQWDTLALRFRTLTIEDGLSQGMVTSIVQDKYGFMWFGTKDGLNRYDGYHFTVYRHDPADSTTVRDNYIYSLLVDRQGRLWVGTGIGLDLFDPMSEKFTHFSVERSEVERGFIQNIVEDHHGDLWLGCSTGLAKLTFSAPDSTVGPPGYTVKRFFSSGTGINIDSDGLLWGSEQWASSFTIKPDHEGFDQVDTLDLSGLQTTNDGLILYGVRSISNVVDDTLRDRHYVIEASRILERGGPDHQLKTLFQFSKGKGGINGNRATLDGEGRIWFGFYQGLFRFDPVHRKIQKLVARDPDLRLSALSAGLVFRDRSGLLWIGTRGYGVLIYDPKMERFHTVPGPGVHSLSPGNNGKVVVAANEVFVSVYDPAMRDYSLSVPLGKFEELPVMHVISQWNMGTVQDRTGTFWLNYGGLVSYTVGDQAPVSHRAFDGLTEDVTKSSTVPIFLDGDSLIWFGSEGAFGRYDRRSSTYAWFPWPITSGITEGQFTNAIIRNRDGIFWIGTQRGLCGYDPRKATWRHFAHDTKDTSSLAVDMIYSLALDQKDENQIWAGTNGGGLARIDLRTGKVKRFNTKDGLPNDVVYGILNDFAGRLWLSTNIGICRFDPATNSFRNFDATYGLQSNEFNRYAYCALPDGTLFFGGVKGFNYFNPKDIVDDSTASPIRITNIKLVNKVLDHREADSPLKAPAYLSQGMTIPMSDNMVTFEFASMEFSAPVEHRYQYKLDGFDKDWIMSGHERTAIYTNLDPGKYTFHVRGDNRDGIWDTQGTSFQLEVLPPWWRTWWFYSLCALALGGAVVLYLRRQRHHKQFLEKTVQERTSQLSTAKERAEQSERVKQQFLANMSHEIRTPMNAIMGMTGILKRNDHLPDQEKYLNAVARSSEN
ncbi:MAG: two-component regulator propeller domain-containing protein, partial [Flavobacteriales bacterium]